MYDSKISVIVPVYKVEDYLNECVESIVRQSYTNLEIILVDDGSPDNCGKMIDEWAIRDERIVALHKENGGLGDARNYGFAHSTGEYIAFIDSDDYVDEKYFEKLLSALTKNDADMAGCRFYRNNLEGEGFLYPSKDNSFDFCVSQKEYMEKVYNNFGNFCVAWAKLYKRCVIKEKQFPKVRICEDALCVRDIAFRCNKVAWIQDALYMYRNRAGSIINSNYSSRASFMEGTKWLDNDIEFYILNNENRLRAVAEKAYCYSVLNAWKNMDDETRKYSGKLYTKRCLHLLFSPGNSFKSKIKYLVYLPKIYFKSR